MKNKDNYKYDENDINLYTICEDIGNNTIENPSSYKEGIINFENKIISLIEKFQEYLPIILNIFKISNTKV